MRGSLLAAIACFALLPIAAPASAQTLSEADLAKLDFREIINQAKGKVFPAVVFIKCVSENFDSGNRVTQESTGSGVLISDDGEILTNWHVIDKAVEVRCLLLDGSSYDATVVGSDKDTDLALIKLDLPENAKPLAYATLGQSERLREGDFVMAMGAPWGLSRSVSLGIVSCCRRFLAGASEYSLWLQTDASISPGNSGGPLVDTSGEVIGINARGMVGGGGDLGFAIPSETIRQVLPELRKHGKVNWSWTGIELQPINDFNRNMNFGGDSGVIVADTEDDSPARAAGLRPRDRILRIDGQPVTAVVDEDLPGIRRQLGLLAKDKPALLHVKRGEETLVLELIPRDKGSVEGDAHEFPRWDFTAKTINQFANPDLYFHRQQGIFVQGVKYPGNAANSGLQPLDIILKVGDEPVTTLDDLKRLHRQAIEDVRSEHRKVLTVLRNGLMRQVVLDYSRDHSKR